MNNDQLLWIGFGIMILFLVLQDNFKLACSRKKQYGGGYVEEENGLLHSNGFNGYSLVEEEEYGIIGIPESELIEGYHVIASGQCNFYQDWQMAVLWWSLRENWNNARFTRLLNCGGSLTNIASEEEEEEMIDEKRRKYKYGSIMPTVWAPDWAIHPRSKDKYAPYNKPLGVVEFLKNNSIKERWIVVIDPDQIVKKPMNDLKPMLGKPVAQKVTFPMKNLDHVGKYFGLKMKEMDQVSVPIIIHQNDLRRLAPLWLKITEMIREVPQLKKWAGWIAEMYGYIIAAGLLGLKHQLRHDLGDRIPYNVKNSYSLHYDLEHKSKDKKLKWNKRSYMNRDMLDSDEQMPVFSESNSPTREFASVTETINRALNEVRRQSIN